MAAADSMSTGSDFVDALAQAPLPLPRPSSTALHRVAMTAFAVTLRGGTRATMRQRLTRSSLTETGRTRSSRPFRYLSRTSRSTGLVATMSPARIPIGIRSRFTQAASGAFLRPLLFSGGVFSPPSSTFSLQDFPIKSRSSIMSRRIGSCVKCVDHPGPFIFPVLTRSILVHVVVAATRVVVFFIPCRQLGCQRRNYSSAYSTFR
jgi:hypothetical protein